jgi:hypothetical protein
MMPGPTVRVGDTVVVINSQGLKVEGKVVHIEDDGDSGRALYKVASPDFALLVPISQIIEVHQK